jgi:hypothetical protein
MSKRPELRVIRGSKETEERRRYRLRSHGASGAPGPAIEWPQAGAWRDLVHRLMRTPAESD